METALVHPGRVLGSDASSEGYIVANLSRMSSLQHLEQRIIPEIVPTDLNGDRIDSLIIHRTSSSRRLRLHDQILSRVVGENTSPLFGLSPLFPGSI